MIGRFIAVAVVGLALLVPAVSTAAGNGNHPRSVNARQHRQAARVRDGVEDGQLTRGERNRIRGDEAAIRAEERVYRRSGGGLNRAEQRDLQHDLNRTSREIYRDKHNDRTPADVQ
jgi:hypothetical protein